MNFQSIFSHPSQPAPSWEPKRLIYSCMGKASQDIVIFPPKWKIPHGPAEGWLIGLIVVTLKTTNIVHTLEPLHLLLFFENPIF